MPAMPRDAIRSELCGLIAAASANAARAPARQLAHEVDAIRRLAHSNGFAPAVTVAHLLGDALARGEHGAMVRDWLSMLADAVGCDQADANTCDVFAAACSVRLAH